MKTRFLSFVMAMLMMLSCFAGCKEQSSENASNTKNDNKLVLSSEYVVIRPDLCDDLTKDSAVKIRDRLNEAFSLDIVLKTDFLMKDEQPSAKEIIIGETSRETSFDRSTLKENEYKVVIEEDKIIIDAFDSLTLYYAVDEIVDGWVAQDGLKNSKGELVISKDLEQVSSSVSFDSQSIRFMSQNLRYTDDPNGNSIDERSKRFKKLVEDYAPDIIGTQETTAKWNNLLKNMFKDKYSVYTGYSRNGKNETSGEYGTILYRKDRFELVKGGTFWLSDTPNQKSKYEESSHYRICTYVILNDKYTGREILFTNVHLSGGTVAEKQLKVMGEVLEDELKKYPTFLTGDFNAHPDSTTYAYADKILDDAYTTAVENKATINYTAHDYGALTNAYRIDWCFYSDDMKCSMYNTLTDMYNGYVSDHYGIIAECILG